MESCKIEFKKDSKGYDVLHSDFFEEHSIKPLEKEITTYFVRTKKKSIEDIFSIDVHNEALNELFDTTNIKRKSTDNSSYFLLADRLHKQSKLVNDLYSNYKGKFMGENELGILSEIISNEIRKYNLRSHNYNYNLDGANTNKKNEKNRFIPIIERELKGIKGVQRKKISGRSFMESHKKLLYGLSDFVSEKADTLRIVNKIRKKLEKELIKVLKKYGFRKHYKATEEYNSFLNVLLPKTTYGLSKMVFDKNDFNNDYSFNYRASLMNRLFDCDFISKFNKDYKEKNKVEMNSIFLDGIFTNITKKYHSCLLKLLPDSDKIKHTEISFSGRRNNYVEQYAIAQ